MSISEGAAETKAERLAQARKKLRDYQSKHRSENKEFSLSSSASISSIIENNGRRSAISLQLCDHVEMKDTLQRVQTGSHDSPPMTTENVVNNNISNTNSSALSNDLRDKFQQNGPPELCSNVPEDLLDLKQECIRLREELALRTAEKGQLSSQLAELVGHYSQIHASYTKLSEYIKNGDPSGSALQTQLVHLQTAMSVVVKEKTALQQQLRQKNELVMDRDKQICNLTVEMQEKISHISSLEAEIILLRKEINSLSNEVQRQVKESKNGQEEAVNWQTKLLHIQQDRDDAKERLKICMKKAEAAQAELDEARKQLRMKDIYLRQLGAYTSTDTPLENDNRNLSDEIEQLKSGLVRAVDETEKWKKEAQLARERYELYGTQLNQNIVQMSAKLEEMSNEKLVLESKVQALESEIKMLRTIDRPNLLNDDNTYAKNSIELQKVQNKLVEVTNDYQRAKQLIEELNTKLANKEQEVLTLSSALSDEKSKLIEKNAELVVAEESLARARSVAEEQKKHTEEALSLSEQLQNEKATVSRAITQNRELKEQLIELQDKLIAVTQESMERENGRLSALHQISQLRNELNRVSGQSFGGKNVDSSTIPMIPNGDIYEQQQNVPYVDSRDRDETISTPSVSECYDRDMSLSHTEDTHAHTEVELANVRMVLDELRLDHRRVVQENEELRRIMEQNSEDENQNNIHVELGQAVERISTLSAENEQLRNDISMLQEKLNSASLSSNVSPSSSHCDTISPVRPNVNVVRQLQAFSIKEKPLAWTELEARFTRAMRQIADLAEEKERLQHVIMQLETENDTIGDYVTLYQHQRKKINERMREREEAVAKLSFEKEQMQQKLNELQKTLINLLSKKGLLRVYAHEKETLNNYNGSSKHSSSVRSYSRGTVDKFSGDEEIVDGSELVPNSPDSCIDISSEFGSGKQNAGDDSFFYISINEIKENILGDNADDDVGVQRILNLISELQDLERTRTFAPCSPNLHCSECRGKLINL
uniref:Golgin subfamily A conserved domain-containing protein n=1 Tax=Onchocerca volvulus TaxID=6282 RepID=A0A8R1XJT3_ONCVO